MSSDAPRADGALVRSVGTVLVAMMVSAITVTAAGLLIDALAPASDVGEVVRGFGILVMLGTPFAALVRVAVHGASRGERVLAMFPLATVLVVLVGILLAR